MKALWMDPYVPDTLLRDLVGHDHRPSAYLVYVYLWGRTGGRKGATATLSLGALAEETGLSKRAVQSAVAHLERRRLIRLTRAAVTAVPAYEVLRPWKR
ncbi:MAG: helix-turn-helix domain-containing protein, partial [Candidatus Eisenbacteria bacterium]